MKDGDKCPACESGILEFQPLTIRIESGNQILTPPRVQCNWCGKWFRDDDTSNIVRRRDAPDNKQRRLGAI